MFVPVFAISSLTALSARGVAALRVGSRSTNKLTNPTVQPSKGYKCWFCRCPCFRSDSGNRDGQPEKLSPKEPVRVTSTTQSPVVTTPFIPKPRKSPQNDAMSHIGGVILKDTKPHRFTPLEGYTTYLEAQTQKFKTAKLTNSVEQDLAEDQAEEEKNQISFLTLSSVEEMDDDNSQGSSAGSSLPFFDFGDEEWEDLSLVTVYKSAVQHQTGSRHVIQQGSHMSCGATSAAMIVLDNERYYHQGESESHKIRLNPEIQNRDNKGPGITPDAVAKEIRAYGTKYGLKKVEVSFRLTMLPVAAKKFGYQPDQSIWKEITHQPKITSTDLYKNTSNIVLIKLPSDWRAPLHWFVVDEDVDENNFVYIRDPYGGTESRVSKTDFDKTYQISAMISAQHK